MEMVARARGGRYLNIFGLPISPMTPWEHQYENMDDSHRLPNYAFTIIMECARTDDGRWDVSYSLNGVPMHRGFYDLKNANDLVLYTIDMRARIISLRIESCSVHPVMR